MRFWGDAMHLGVQFHAFGSLGANSALTGIGQAISARTC